MAVNLLPIEEQKSRRRAYVLRLSTVGLFLLSSVFLAGALLLLPSYFLLQVRAKAVAEEERVLAESRGAGELSPAQVLRRLDKQIELVRSYAALPAMTELIGAIIVRQEEPVTLTSFAYEAQGEGARLLTLEGVAESREALVSFSRALEAEPRFARVELPISNLASNRDINFTVRLHLAAE